jgi:hypothetical protein
LAYNTEALPNGASASIAFSGLFLSGIADYGLKRFEKQKVYLENCLGNIISELDKNDLEKIKEYYQQLTKLHADVSLIDLRKEKQPFQDFVNKFLTDFLEIREKLNDNRSNFFTLNLDEIQSEMEEHENQQKFPLKIKEQ